MKALKIFTTINLLLSLPSVFLSLAYPNVWANITEMSIYNDVYEDLYYGDQIEGTAVFFMGLMLMLYSLSLIIYGAIILILNKTSKLNNLLLNTSSIVAIIYNLPYALIAILYFFWAMVRMTDGDAVLLSGKQLLWFGDVSITWINSTFIIMGLLSLYAIYNNSKKLPN